MNVILPVAKDIGTVSGRGQAELEGRVEVVLLLVGAVHHAAGAHHHVARVTDVGRAHHAGLAV